MSRRASPSRFTTAGSRWSKKLLGLPVQRRDGRHIVGAELDIEDGEVLRDAVRADRFRDRHYAALGQPAQNDLRHGLPVFLGEATSTSLWKMSCLPSAKGPQDSICTPLCLQETAGFRSAG